MKATRKSKTRFVPKVVYRTAFAGVVPVCVAVSACGGSVVERGATSDGGQDGGDEFTNTGGVGCAAFACSVGAQAFDGGYLDVAALAFDGNTGSEATPFFGVADGAFDGGVAESGFGAARDAMTNDGGDE